MIIRSQSVSFEKSFQVGEISWFGFEVSSTVPSLLQIFHRGDCTNNLRKLSSLSSSSPPSIPSSCSKNFYNLLLFLFLFLFVFFFFCIFFFFPVFFPFSFRCKFIEKYFVLCFTLACKHFFSCKSIVNNVIIILIQYSSKIAVLVFTHTRHHTLLKNLIEPV